MSYFDVRIPGPEDDRGGCRWPARASRHRGRVPHRDCRNLDVIVEPSGQDAFTIFAQSLTNRLRRGHLAVRAGLRAAVPELDAGQC